MQPQLVPMQPPPFGAVPPMMYNYPHSNPFDPYAAYMETIAAAYAAISQPVPGVIQGTMPLPGVIPGTMPIPGVIPGTMPIPGVTPGTMPIPGGATAITPMSVEQFAKHWNLNDISTNCLHSMPPHLQADIMQTFTPREHARDVNGCLS